MTQASIQPRPATRFVALACCAVAAAFTGTTLISSAALAQSRNLDFNALNDRRAPPPKTKEARKKACSEYGAGFYKLEGSDTCMRVGGGIDVTVGSGRGLMEAPPR